MLISSVDKIEYSYLVLSYSSYKFIAAILGMCILVGSTIPSGLHTASMEICQMMEIGNDGHSMPAGDRSESGHEDCPMEQDSEQSAVSVSQHSTFHNGLFCACDIDQAPLDTEVPLSKTVNAKVLLLVRMELDQLSAVKNLHPRNITLTDSFSPPPIFLSNETFLI